MKAAFTVFALAAMMAPLAAAQAPVQVQPNRPEIRTALTERASAGAPFEMTNARGGALNGGWAGPSALQAFRLHFANGDHKIKSVVVSRAGTVSDLRIADNDGNDPFEARARYLPLNATYPVQTATTDCLGRCFLRIPAAAGKAFVLSGFSLNHTTSDHDMVEIGIIPHLKNGLIEVRYEKYYTDRPGFSQPIAASAIAIQYVLIPEGALTFQSHCTDNEGCASPRSGEVNVVLQGFHCGYAAMRSANLLAFGIDPRTRPPSVFQDNDTHEGGRCMTLIAGVR